MKKVENKKNILRWIVYVIVAVALISIIYYKIGQSVLGGIIFDVSVIIILPILLLLSSCFELCKSILLFFKKKDLTLYKKEIRNFSYFDIIFYFFLSIYVMITSLTMVTASTLRFPLVLILNTNKFVHSIGILLFLFALTMSLSIISVLYFKIRGKA